MLREIFCRATHNYDEKRGFVTLMLSVCLSVCNVELPYRPSHIMMFPLDKMSVLALKHFYFSQY